ncbi:molybdopterin-synthase adenylyltransferase MoeB [Sanguibacter gelidistatuariae]|uniref:molybdopterin-synthase adenylyltransferase MoeB n=1 Tax=Sanguibacter gelidistatuariae TaxID=1814289 RepID=UPI001FE0E19E|nr:molybdopterin-synthase adenylyltransferase MoeB [Sanguibacter gelidistatuariae]
MGGRVTSTASALATLGPLVAESAPLPPAELARYARQITLPQIGMSGQRRLKNARVLVVGAGGLGSPALLYLAAAGVGTLGVVDDDRVEESNLHRQVIHGVGDVGAAKVDSARAAVAAINPHVVVETHPVRLTAANALDILGGYDLVLDGADNFATRYLVNDACEILGIPCVWGAILTFHGQVSVFWAAPPSGVEGVTYRDIFPEAPPAGSVPSCAEGGVLGALCATVGSVMVNEAIKLITGAGRSLLGRLALYDALEVSWRELSIGADPSRMPVTELIDTVVACEVPAPGTGVGAGPDAGAAPVEITARGLAALLASGTDVHVLDVREAFEREIVAIEGSVHVPMAQLLADGGLAAVPTDRPVVVHCKVGGRSQAVVDAARRAGMTNVANLTGGVLAWVRDVDPSLPTY